MSGTVPPLAIGIDGGGSRCRAAVAAPDGRVLGRGEAGPANATTDLPQAAGNIVAAVGAALAAAGAGPAEVGAVHAGLAGVMGPDDAARVAAALPFAGIAVTDDRPTSVEGALGPRDGALAAVGTGSFLALKRGAALRCVGGWGAEVGDQASGAWLGRALLERVLLACDGLAPGTGLTRATLAAFGGDPNAIVRFAAAARPADLAAHAPRVADAAEGGDPAGLDLMRRGADYLGQALDAFGLRPGEVLCLTGGLGPRYAAFLAEDHRARIAAPEGDALHGAVRLALAALSARRGAA
jgi:glucosamine kinase